MGACYIVGAGSFYGLRSRPGTGDLVIAADGGYAACLREHVTPDLVVGDFDSLKKEPQQGQVVHLPVEKDDTDTLAAIRMGLDRGYRQFHLYGGTGGERPEHTVANLQCLLFLAERGAAGWLYDRTSVCTVLRDGALRFPAGCRGNLSVFAAGGPALGVTLRGLKYSLNDADLTPSLPLGVSNAFTGAAAEIRVRSGTLLVWYDLQDS